MNFKWMKHQDKNISDAFDIRYKVFVDEQGYAKEIEYDNLDHTATHIVGYIENTPACTARVFFEHPTVMHIGRVCVLPQYRGKGIGAELMNEIEKYAKGLTGVTSMELGSQVPKQGFYKSLGYAAFGDEFLDGGEPHIMMKKNI